MSPPPPLQLEGASGAELLGTALAASLLTRRPFELRGLAAREGQPGLQAAEVALVRAARAIASANVVGGEQGSDAVSFEPGAVRTGDYLLDVGPGALADAIRTLAFPLSCAAAPSRLKLRGLTHAPGRPVWHELLLVWEPAMRRLGFDFGLELRAAGYPPEGGGEADLEVRAGGPAVRFDRRSRGTLLEARVLSVISRLPLAAAEAQSERALQRLRERGILAEADNLPLPAPRSKGASCMVLGRFERGTSAFSALYDPERPQGAADEASSAFCAFMESGGGVPPEQARDLLLPLAMVAAGLRGGERHVSRFTTSRITPALAAEARLLASFFEVEIAVLGTEGHEGELRVAPPGAGLRDRIADLLRERSGEPS